jgi:hypothetical protein
MEITAEKFKASVGTKPIQDDLERCNCKLAGNPGHRCCGWDNERDMPVFIPGESKAAVPNPVGTPQRKPSPRAGEGL